MKRSGAELPLCTWSGCGGRLNGVAVATVKRGGGGDAPHCVLSRCASIINGTACCLPAVLPRTLDANLRGAACGASLWAAECGMHVIWPCGGVRPREMRVEGHGSPRAINKCALLLCCFRSFYSSAAIPERSPTPLHYPLAALADGARRCVRVRCDRWANRGASSSGSQGQAKAGGRRGDAGSVWLDRVQSSEFIRAYQTANRLSWP